MAGRTPSQPYRADPVNGPSTWGDDRLLGIKMVVVYNHFYTHKMIP
jgi:hypothetical protein